MTTIDSVCLVDLFSIPEESTTCPQCKLINPEGSLRCDCGYEFVVNGIDEAEPNSRFGRPANWKPVRILIYTLAAIIAAALIISWQSDDGFILLALLNLTAIPALVTLLFGGLVLGCVLVRRFLLSPSWKTTVGLLGSLTLVEIAWAAWRRRQSGTSFDEAFWSGVYVSSLFIPPALLVIGVTGGMWRVVRSTLPTRFKVAVAIGLIGIIVFWCFDRFEFRQVSGGHDPRGTFRAAAVFSGAWTIAVLVLAAFSPRNVRDRLLDSLQKLLTWE